jgi:hypothetical protein
MTTPLLEALAQAAPVPTAPKGFEPGFKYSPAGALDSVNLSSTEKLEDEEAWVQAAREAGVPVPEDMTLQLVEVRMGHNQAAWHRDADRIGENHTAYTAPNTTWHYRFKVIPRSLWRGKDYDALLKQVQRAVRGKGYTPKSTKTTKVIILGDFQTGKTDYLGGTPELLERSETALAEVLRQVRREKPAEIALIDVGDSSEQFMSAPNAAQTNDLDQTEQVRVWRRIFWRWVSALAVYGVPLKVLGVPSNHCRVKSAKGTPAGKPSDDWGLEAVAQLADMASVNPEAYGHVEFYVPETHDEHLALTLVGGKVIGAVHGHQKSSVAGLLQWCEGQAAGRSPVGHADIIFAGHHHHLEINTWGDHRWLFVAPTMDAGSSWYSNLTGRKSRDGVLTLTVDENGWRDLEVAWV